MGCLCTVVALRCIAIYCNAAHHDPISQRNARLLSRTMPNFTQRRHRRRLQRRTSWRRTWPVQPRTRLRTPPWRSDPRDFGDFGLEFQPLARYMLLLVGAVLWLTCPCGPEAFLRVIVCWIALCTGGAHQHHLRQRQIPAPGPSHEAQLHVADRCRDVVMPRMSEVARATAHRRARS